MLKRPQTPLFKGWGALALDVPDLKSPFMKLNDKQRRYLRGLAHPLKPLILIGNAGISEGVIAEARRALYAHELIKVRMAGVKRDALDAAVEKLAGDTSSVIVSRIGHVATLYKERTDLPKKFCYPINVHPSQCGPIREA